MKCLVSHFAFLLAFGPWAKGDLTLTQEIEGGPQKGEIVMRVKGDRLRLDLPGGPTGRMSAILDLKTGDTTTLSHGKKLAITRKGADLQRAAETEAKQAGKDPAQKIELSKPMATGLKERVGEYEAEVFTIPMEGSKDTLWVVRDFPEFSAIEADLRRVNQASVAGINRAGTLDVTSLPGMVVKRQKERGGQKMTIIFKSVTQDAIEDSVFEIPAEYRPVTPRPTAREN